MTRRFKIARESETVDLPRRYEATTPAEGEGGSGGSKPGPNSSFGDRGHGRAVPAIRAGICAVLSGFFMTSARAPVQTS